MDKSGARGVNDKLKLPQRELAWFPDQEILLENVESSALLLKDLARAWQGTLPGRSIREVSRAEGPGVCPVLLPASPPRASLRGARPRTF